MSSGLTALMVLLSGPAALGQCRLIQEGNFRPQNKRVRLVARPDDASGANKVILFKTSLRVNTDGAPNSYHPQDLTGSVRAINNICNGVAVYPAGSRTRLRCPAARRVFARFRDRNWRVPPGYRIGWQNVIAARNEGGRVFPCVFRSGDYSGYFGSLTSLKNDLSGEDAGECDHKNQLDQRFIPAFVIPGGRNVLREFEADKGDLLLVYNPRNGVMVATLIGDVGPPEKLGEGSVGLNMALLRRTALPTTYREALRLDTGRDEMLVAVMPKSKDYNLEKPYTKENIGSRVAGWIAKAGFASQSDFVEFMRRCDQ